MARLRVRRDAKVQTMARAEEKRYLLKHRAARRAVCAWGGGGGRGAAVGEDVPGRRYTAQLEGTLLPRFGELAIGKVDGAAAAQLDLELSERGLARATRNNVQVVIRSVLRFAVARKYLRAMPEGMPRLKPVGQSMSFHLEVLSRGDKGRARADSRATRVPHGAPPMMIVVGASSSAPPGVAGASFSGPRERKTLAQIRHNTTTMTAIISSTFFILLHCDIAPRHRSLLTGTGNHK
jgi:hypothetical protein